MRLNIIVSLKSPSRSNTISYSKLSYIESTTTSPCCLARYLSLLSFWKQNQRCRWRREAFVKKVTYYNLQGNFSNKKLSKHTHPFIYDEPFSENLRTCIFWGSLTCLNSSISLNQLKLQFFQSLNNTIIRRQLDNVYIMSSKLTNMYIKIRKYFLTKKST